MLDALYRQPFPTLRVNTKYLLREQILPDSESFYQYFTDPRVDRYILASKPTNLEEAKREIQACRDIFYQKKGIQWAIARYSDNKMIGAIGMYINNHNARGEIFYDLNPKYWHKGIMSKALTVVISHAFNNIGLTRIEATTLKENTPSTALLKKLGFKREGTLQKYRYYQEKFYDVEMYACISSSKNKQRQIPTFHATLRQATTRNFNLL